MRDGVRSLQQRRAEEGINLKRLRVPIPQRVAGS
jgi:hypothetical protein